MTLLKVSGLTTPDDVDLAIAVGAWALGFAVAGEAQRPGAHGPLAAPGGPVSASHRGRAPAAGALGLERAAELTALARRRSGDVLTVAYVAGDDAPAIAAAARASGVAAVEIDAGADAAAVRAAMRAAGLAGAPLIAARDAAASEEADYVVFPFPRVRVLGEGGGAYSPAEGPATWDPFTKPAYKRVIVAGAIDAAGVGDLVRRIHPFAVDVTAGLRTTAGLFDEATLRALAAAAAAADVPPWGCAS